MSAYAAESFDGGAAMVGDPVVWEGRVQWHVVIAEWVANRVTRWDTWSNVGETADDVLARVMVGKG